MDGSIKQYKKSIIKHNQRVRELEGILGKEMCKEDVDAGKNKETKKQIQILNIEIQAFQKQVPLKVTRESIYSPALCPTCKDVSISKDMGDGYYTYLRDIKYCPECGQLLEWD